MDVNGGTTPCIILANCMTKRSIPLIAFSGLNVRPSRRCSRVEYILTTLMELVGLLTLNRRIFAPAGVMAQKENEATHTLR